MSESGKPTPPPEPFATLKRLGNTANLQATMHAAERDRYSRANLWLTVGALILTASLLPLSLVSDDFVAHVLGMNSGNFKLLTALIALAAFVLVLIQLSWRPDTLSSAHAQAVNHFTRAKFEARRLQQFGEVTLNHVAQLEDKYLDVRDLPPIKEHRFLPLKKWHRQKIKVSIALDRDSSLNIDQRLQQKQECPSPEDGNTT